MLKFLQKKQGDKVEERFQAMLDLVRDLDRAEFRRMMDALTLTWQGYDKSRKIQTIDEKEVADITNSEKKLEYIEEVEDERN